MNLTTAQRKFPDVNPQTLEEVFDDASPRKNSTASWGTRLPLRPQKAKPKTVKRPDCVQWSIELLVGDFRTIEVEGIGSRCSSG
jgi:hypothetical protein